MVDNNTTRTVREVHASSMSGNSDDELADDSTMLPVVSDVLQINHGVTPGTSLPHHPRHQHSLGKQSIPKLAATTSTFPSQSRPQLAVHIRPSLSSSSSHTRQARPPLGSGRVPEHTTRPKISAALPSAWLETGRPSLQPKKRGRPKGWKPGMSYTGAKATIRGSKRSKPEPPVVPSGEPKRRGRPPSSPVLTPREWYLKIDAEFAPFKCEWHWPGERPCPAELQNMKTLRKHVHMVHSDSDPLVCAWGKCAARENPIKFAGQTEFEEHIEREHFRSFVWYRGDGHLNDGISELKLDADELPAYLFDKDGNQVTPSVTEQQLDDEQQSKERKRKLRRITKQADENIVDDDTWQKQILGIA
ncbi:hypothetical protein F4677DRAFT_95050 [Hypoxylon crocopeplum]|nr:hypothetical protein F4677DRAFT_95050 [Hypoxylon crocopeplum]